MIQVCNRLAHEYPNAILIAVGTALVILPELHAKAVFWACYRLHHQNWTPQPFIARVVDLWWAAEHTPPFMAVAIL